MEDFGLRDAVEIENRKFVVHTGTLLEQSKIISEIFEEGMFLISREYSIALRREGKIQNYEFLAQLTNEFHERVISELDALYRIRNKLRRFKHPKSNYYLGVLFLRRNLYEEAIEQFRTAIALDKNYIRAFVGLGISYLKARKFRQALEVFQKALMKNEKYPDVLNYLGLAYLFSGDYDHATTLFKNAIQLNPDYVEAQFNLGVALYKSALEGVRDPRAVAVPARVFIYLKQVRAQEKYRTPEWEKECNELLELLKDNNHEIIIPQLERFQLKLVEMLAEKEKIYEFYLRFLYGGKVLDLRTIEYYEPFFLDETKRRERYPDYWNDLGTYNLIRSRGLYMKAIAEFEKAIEMQPDFREAREILEKVKSNEKGFIILLRAILK